jgi:hypothetical protein
MAGGAGGGGAQKENMNRFFVGGVFLGGKREVDVGAPKLKMKKSKRKK